MPTTAKRVPATVLQKARAEAAALTKHYTVAAPTPVPLVAPVEVKKLPREKVVAALKRLHPMD